MQVLIVDDNVARQTELSIAFIEAGFQPIATASIGVAERCIRKGWIDLVVMSERIGGRLTHSLALLAEWRNPVVATMLLTARHDEDCDELFLLLPSLHCLLAPDTDAKLVTKLSLASAVGASKSTPPMMLTPELRIGEKVDAVPIFASSRAQVSVPERARRYA